MCFFGVEGSRDGGHGTKVIMGDGQPLVGPGKAPVLAWSHRLLGQDGAGLILEGDRSSSWAGASADLSRDRELKLESGVLRSRAACASKC